MVQPTQMLGHLSSIRLQKIDPALHANGRFGRFLEINKAQIVGHCLNLLGFDGASQNTQIGRSRLYDVEQDDKIYHILGDTFINFDHCEEELHKILTALRIALSWNACVDFNRVLWPANLWSSQLSARASDFWCRKLSANEIDGLPDLLKRLQNISSPIFCIDENRIEEVKYFLQSRLSDIRFSGLISKNMLTIAEGFVKESDGFYGMSLAVD